MIILTLTVAIAAIFSYAPARHAAGETAVDGIGLSSARDFLYASQPQSPTEDSALITAQLYAGGRPLKKAGVPVNFSLGDGRFATLDASTVPTDEWGTAATRVRSYDSGLSLPGHPFPLAVTASVAGKSAQITIPVTGQASLSGRVTDKNGDPVEGATISLVYSGTGKPVKARGSTTTTDISGRYRLDRVPTDMGDITVYVKKGTLETSTPANSSSAIQMR